MKKFKKTAALTLAAAMCVNMNVCTVAYADTLEDEGSSSAEVTATYESSETATIYSVDITWGSLEFTYTEAGAQTWNPSTHTYSEAEEGGWSCEEGSNILTITNHSNSAVIGKVWYFTADAYVADVTLSVEYDDMVYENGEGYSAALNSVYHVLYFLKDAAECALENPDSAPYIEIPFVLSGDPDEFEESVTIGTVKVTLTSATGYSSADDFINDHVTWLTEV